MPNPFPSAVGVGCCASEIGDVRHANAGLSDKRMKGLERSTFCMASGSAGAGGGVNSLQIGVNSRDQRPCAGPPIHFASAVFGVQNGPKADPGAADRTAVGRARQRRSQRRVGKVYALLLCAEGVAQTGVASGGFKTIR